MNDAPAIENTEFETVRVLLVEDEDGCALLLQAMLTHWRYGAFDIRRAASLSSAVKAVAEAGIDLVLLDLGLPDSQGIGTFVRMRAAAVKVPIIVLSGLDDEALATLTVQRGAQDYIVKGSVDTASLARAIRYAIERSRAQQTLAEEHDRLRSVMDNIPDQVYLKDMESRFVSVNPVTARFFGASSPDEVIGKSDFDYFPHELASQFLTEERALLHHDQPCVNREEAITDSAGNTRWLLTTKVPLRDHGGNITGMLGINRDITERKEAEEGIRRLNALLEQRVAKRTNELREAMVRLEEHDRARSEFVSSVSHELKTPLTSMQFGIGNLLEGVVGPMPDRVTQYLERLKTDCQRMAETVEDILDFSRLESKTMQLQRERFLLARLVRKAMAALTAQAEAKRIEMVLPIDLGPGFVECDAFKMVRAMVNIIGNAIKFTPEGGRVEIGLHRDAADLVVEITDSGIGIAPQHLERVTEKYFRGGEHVSGAGLGLSIAKEIVELHGGRLAIRSPPPERAGGTRVSISMPAAEPATILVAHDDEPMRDLLEQQLSACGYHVTTCANGDESIDLARQVRPDAGIFEVSKSVTDREDVIFRMKADPSLRAIPIVAITGGMVDPARQMVLNGLGIPTVPKPWREGDLLDCIEAAIRGRTPSNVPNT